MLNNDGSVKLCAMKKSVFILLSCVVITLPLAAQLVPNGSFEEWQLQSTFEEPVGYFTTNTQSYFTTGEENVIKTTDSHSGNFAARLETIEAPDGIIPGGVFIGSPGPEFVAGGIPYTESPDSVKVWAKFNLVANDTAFIIFMFKSGGLPIGFAPVTFAGNQNNYSQYVFPVNWVVGLPPDTLAMIAFSSSPEGGSGPGSVLFLDDVLLNGVTTQIPNNGFEDWLSFDYYEPVDWLSSNFMTFTGSGLSATQSTEHIDGDYSIRIETQLTVWNDTISFVTNGYVGENGPAGGMPVDQVPEKMTFYYKYFPVGQDSALAGGWLYYYDPVQDSSIVLEEELIKLAAADEWTYIEIPFNLVGTPLPDTMNIAFTASNIKDEGAIANPGSVLFVDKVEVFLQTSLPENPDVFSGSLEIKPNPAVDYIEIRADNLNSGLASVVILDEQGKRVIEPCNMKEDSGWVRLDISGLGAGCYFVLVQNNNRVYSARFVK